MRIDALRNDLGQSLVELALSLPLLLVLLVGVGDVARVYAYTIAVSNAAREAAMLAVREPESDAARVAQRACDEMGLVPYGDPCPAELSVTTVPSPSFGEDATVEVRYAFTPILASLTQRLFTFGPIAVRAHATMPGQR